MPDEQYLRLFCDLVHTGIHINKNKNSVISHNLIFWYNIHALKIYLLPDKSIEYCQWGKIV